MIEAFPPRTSQTALPSSLEARLGHGLDPNGPDGGPGAGILVVDDEVSVRYALRACLVHLGFRVWTAANGEEAVDVLERFPGQIAAVLLDDEMPGPSVRQTLNRLRKLDPEVRACLMTAVAGCYAQDQWQRLGVRYVFSKPFNLFQLASVFRQLVGAVAAE